MWQRDARMMVLICPTWQRPSACGTLARRAITARTQKSYRPYRPKPTQGEHGASHDERAMQPTWNPLHTPNIPQMLPIHNAKMEHHVPRPHVSSFESLTVSFFWRREYRDWTGGFAVQPCPPAGRHGRRQIARNTSRKCLREFHDRSSIYRIMGQPAHAARELSF
jgi:hypothetical protein